MIKVTTRNGETDLSIIGDLSVVCADTVSIVVAIRKSLDEHDPRIGELYEKAMKAGLIKLAFDPEATKVDKAEEKDKETEKATESEDIEDALKEIASLLSELLK